MKYTFRQWWFRLVFGGGFARAYGRNRYYLAKAVGKYSSALVVLARFLCKSWSRRTETGSSGMMNASSLVAALSHVGKWIGCIRFINLGGVFPFIWRGQFLSEQSHPRSSWKSIQLNEPKGENWNWRLGDNMKPFNAGHGQLWQGSNMRSLGPGPLIAWTNAS